MKMAEIILSDISNLGASNTYGLKLGILQSDKGPKIDLSLQGEGWVTGCLAALPRRDRGSGPITGEATGGWERPDGPGRPASWGEYCRGSLGYISSRGSFRDVEAGGEQKTLEFFASTKW
jgi:hypothetical protein